MSVFHTMMSRLRHGSARGGLSLPEQSSAADGKAAGRFDTWLVRATLLLFGVPVLGDLIWSGRSAPFHYFAADTFYYLTVARNVAELGRISYDQSHATNGFHPLWQLVLAAMYFIAHKLGAEDPLVLILTILLGLTLTAIGIWFIGRALSRSHRRLPMLFLLLPIGAYGLAISPLWLRYGSRLALQNVQEGSMPLYGTLWSYVNGMESSIAILLFALLFYSYVWRRVLERWQDSAWFGLLLALLTLARLDLGLVVVGVLLGMSVRILVQRQWRQLPQLICMGVAFTIPMLIYCAINLKYFGSPVPVSGALKSRFPLINVANFGRLVWLCRNWNSTIWLAIAYHELQMFVPLLVALAFPLSLLSLRRAGSATRAWVGWRSDIDAVDQWLSLVACGVVLLNGYNILFVDMWGQGNWYYPISILFTSLCALRIVQKRGSGVHTQQSRALAFAACSVLTIVGFFILQRKPDYHQKYADFYFEEAAQIRQHYAGQTIRLIEFDDGILAFSTGYPALSGTGFTLDREGAVAKRQNRLLALAFERGFDRLSTLVYGNASALPLRHDSPAHQIVKALQLGPQALQFQLAVDYLSQSGRFAIIRFTKPPAPFPP